jgi:hypothetical protein
VEDEDEHNNPERQRHETGPLDRNKQTPRDTGLRKEKKNTNSNKK